MTIRNISMRKAFLTSLAVISTLLTTAQVFANGRVCGIANIECNTPTEVVCNFVYDSPPDLYFSYSDSSGSGGGGRVNLPQDIDLCVGDSANSVGGVAPPYVPPEGVIFSASVVTYYHNDALGSPVAATNGDGEVIWREEYRPYGTRLIKEDEGTNEDWFTGKPHEEEFGLSYFGARWYDLESGRFMGIDPVGVDAENSYSFNRYIYANNNPYKYIDPDGRQSKLTTGAPLIGGFDLLGRSGGTGGYSGWRGWSQASPSQMRSLSGGGTKFKITNTPKSPKPEISKQKQAGHVPGTPQNKNRLKQNKPTSTFFGEKSGNRLTEKAFEKGKPLPGRPNVREHEFGISTGTGPNGGIQTRVRVHIDSNGRIHGHPSGPEMIF